ncbi:PASTA domain-containing protein [Thermus sp.]|uniref:PASTA domain-containing protein n=1 Tax=Thermus sp. TaxID=275 RepID=UPI00307E2109
MVIDERYPVLETLEAQDGVTLYRVEGGLLFFFDVKTPEDKERFYRYRAALRRLEEMGLVEATLSAKPGRYYAFFPEKPLARKAPPKAALEALAPLGFGPQHLAMTEGGVAYLAPWPLARRPGGGRPKGFWVGVAPGLLLAALGLLLLGQGLYRYFNPPEYAVPDLVGRSAREAFALLKDTGLELLVEEGNDPTKPKEVVLAQDPPPGTRLRAGRTVRITLNQARLTPLPDLRGLRQEEAEGRLGALGLLLGRVAEVEGEAPLGTVLSTFPLPGTPLPPGGRVDLLVSKGQGAGEAVPLPDLRGLGREEALFLLNAAGLLPQVEEVPSGRPMGEVLEQNPAPGTPLAPGSGVRLLVAVQGQVAVPDLPPELLQAPALPSYPVALNLTLPPEAEGKAVRITLLDAQGERVVYEGEGQADLQLQGSYEVQGEARFRLYLDGVPVQEWSP